MHSAHTPTQISNRLQLKIIVTIADGRTVCFLVTVSIIRLSRPGQRTLQRTTNSPKILTSNLTIGRGSRKPPASMSLRALTSFPTVLPSLWTGAMGKRVRTLPKPGDHTHVCARILWNRGAFAGWVEKRGLVDWLIGRLGDRSIDWLIGRSIDWLIG